MDFGDKVRFGYIDIDDPDPVAYVAPTVDGFMLVDAEDGTPISPDTYPTYEAAVEAGEAMGWAVGHTYGAEDEEQEPDLDDPPF